MNLETLLMMKSELLVLAILFIILFIKVTLGDSPGMGLVSDNRSLINTVNILLLVNFVAGFFMNHGGMLFGDMFVSSELVSQQKNMLNLGTLIISLQSYNWLREHRHAHEFYMLMLATLLGMFFMISAGNLLMFYLALELSTIPLAAMVNFDLGQRRSSEGAFKMIMMSAFASAILLLGISMIYGSTGTVSYEALIISADYSALQLFALVAIIAGFAFKISAVPFHFWTADVYEGAPVSVTSFLSVISKGAMLFAMTSILYRVFQPYEVAWYQVLFILAVATMIIGNLFALRQHNLKRLLAFSSIAQVGFILVGMSGQSAEANTSIIFFVLIYIFSNLGAFGVISLVSALTGKENIDDYKGFYKTNPFLGWVLALSLFSLAGIPPTAGFFGKFFLIIAGAGKENYPLIIIAVLNMVVSLYYYLVVIKAIFMDANENPIPRLPLHFLPKAGLIVCLAGIIITGLYGDIYNYLSSLIAAL